MVTDQRQLDLPYQWQGRSVPMDLGAPSQELQPLYKGWFSLHHPLSLPRACSIHPQDSGAVWCAAQHKGLFSPLGTSGFPGSQLGEPHGLGFGPAEEQVVGPSV